MRKRVRVDNNQPEIVQAMRQVGCEVCPFTLKGMGDVLVSSPFTQRLYLLEVKARRGRLTAAQVEVHRRWQIQVVRSVSEALEAVGASK